MHEGTADDHETTLAFTDPTADRTITFPDLTGTVSLITATETLTNKTLTSPYVNEILHEGTADDFETTLAFTDPTADRTITFPDATGTVALTSNIGTLGVQASNSVDIDGGAIDGVTLAANSPITLSGALQFDSDTFFRTSAGRYLFKRELTVGGIGPSLSLYFDTGGSNTSDGNILGRYEWHGDNSAQQFTDYAYFEGRSLDITDGTEDGEILTWVRTNGGMKNLLLINGTERVFKNDSQAAQITISNSLVTFDESVRFDSPVTFDAGTYGFNSEHGLFLLNSNAATATKDAGFVVERGSTGSNVAWYWDESSGTFNAQYVTGTNTSDTLSVVYMSTAPGIIAGACTFESLTFTGLSETVDRIRDEDDMTSNDENALATQQSIKAYVDANGGMSLVGQSRLNFNGNIVQNIDVTGVITLGTPVWVNLRFSTTGFRFNQSSAAASDGWKYRAAVSRTSNGTTTLTNDTDGTTGIIPNTDLTVFQTTVGTLFPGDGIDVWIYNPNPSSGQTFQLWAPTSGGGQVAVNVWQ